MGYQLQINLSRTLLVTSKGASLMTTAAFAVCMKFFHKEPQHLTSATSRKFWEHLHKNCRKYGEGKEGRKGPPIIFHTPQFRFPGNMPGHRQCLVPHQLATILAFTLDTVIYFVYATHSGDVALYVRSTLQPTVWQYSLYQLWYCRRCNQSSSTSDIQCTVAA